MNEKYLDRTSNFDVWNISEELTNNPRYRFWSLFIFNFL